jgi:hypothetical protein
MAIQGDRQCQSLDGEGGGDAFGLQGSTDGLGDTKVPKGFGAAGEFSSRRLCGAIKLSSRRLCGGVKLSSGRLYGAIKLSSRRLCGRAVIRCIGTQGSRLQ